MGTWGIASRLWRTPPLCLALCLSSWFVQAVIEEIFENQRLQPFRGWGHTWPGHFLPTDKVSPMRYGAKGAAMLQVTTAAVPPPPWLQSLDTRRVLSLLRPPCLQVNHWSRREHEGFPVLASADFNAIAPPLPEVGRLPGACTVGRCCADAPTVPAATQAGWAAGLSGSHCATAMVSIKNAQSRRSGQHQRVCSPPQPVCRCVDDRSSCLLCRSPHRSFVASAVSGHATPQGWQWCEEKWHIDRSPQIIDACDADGWSYGAHGSTEVGGRQCIEGSCAPAGSKLRAKGLLPSMPCAFCHTSRPLACMLRCALLRAWACVTFLSS